MNFENVLTLWTEQRLTQTEAARMLGVCERTFRRYVLRYEDSGLDGLIDKRLAQASARKAPVDEVLALCDRYRSRHLGWNVRHFYTWYRKGGGTRSYTWVKNRLQAARLVPKAKKRGAHRKLRERAALPGMILHQDGSTHQWVTGQMWDLIVTMDDATNEHYSMFFVAQEGTASSFRGVAETIHTHGLCCALYTDRGSHYWHTPEAGGKVDKKNLTQFGRAMHQLGIEMIPAYSPEARGRSERAFRTHQDRLVKELAYHGITTMAAANRYLDEVYRPAFNTEFVEPARERGTAFVPLAGSFFRETAAALGARDCAFLEQAQTLEDTIDRMEEALRNNHIARLNTGECTVTSGLLYIDMLHNLEKIGDHTFKLARSLAEQCGTGERTSS
jgi:transposase